MTRLRPAGCTCSTAVATHPLALTRASPVVCVPLIITPLPPLPGDLLAGVDMAPLHRCVHIHACLGRLPQFAEYYASNRRQQVRWGWAP